MLVRRWFVFLSHLKLLGQAEAQFEPVTDSIQYKMNLLLMGMEPQLPGKLLRLQRSDC